jgi:hypothetical protein
MVLSGGLKGPCEELEFDEKGLPKRLWTSRAQLWTGGPELVNAEQGRQKEMAKGTMTEGNRQGLALVTAEPQELTVVNIVGPISLEKLSKLGGHIGIPHVDVKQEDKTGKK